MQEKRKEVRLKECNAINVSVISETKKIPKEEISCSYNYSEEISASGTIIQGENLLPVDTILKIDFELKTLNGRISVLGRVKWIRIIESGWYEAYVEFIDTPDETIETIGSYISLRHKYKDFNFCELSFDKFARFN
jgi:hypothetical protein